MFLTKSKTGIIGKKLSGGITFSSACALKKNFCEPTTKIPSRHDGEHPDTAEAGTTSSAIKAVVIPDSVNRRALWGASYTALLYLF